MIIRLEALHLAANTAPTDDDAKYALSAIQVGDDGAVSVTNGAYAMRMKSAAQGASLFDDLMDRTDADQATALLVDADEAKAFYDASKKLLKRGGAELPVHVTVSLRGEQIKVATADGLVARRFDIKHDETRLFPDLDKVIPAERPGVEAGVIFDLEYLAAIVKTLKKLKCRSIRLQPPPADAYRNQWRFSASAPAGEIDGAFMPMRPATGWPGDDTDTHDRSDRWHPPASGGTADTGADDLPAAAAPPAAPIDEPARPFELDSPEPKDPAEAKAEGASAAVAGQRVYDNPYPANDPCRAAWDEGWCEQRQSNGMEIPEEFRRKAPTKKRATKKTGGDQ